MAWRAWRRERLNLVPSALVRGKMAPSAGSPHLRHAHLLGGHHAGRRHARWVRRRRPALVHLRPHACTASPHATEPGMQVQALKPTV